MKPATQWIIVLVVAAVLAAVYFFIRETAFWNCTPMWWVKTVYAVLAVLVFVIFCLLTADGKWAEVERRQHEEGITRFGLAWQFIKKELPFGCLVGAIWWFAVGSTVHTYVFNNPQEGG